METPGTGFLQYPAVLVGCCRCFLDWGVCSRSAFRKGIAALPTTHQGPRNFTFLLGP